MARCTAIRNAGTLGSLSGESWSTFVKFKGFDILSSVLPRSHLINHSLTYFNRVRLPSTALLESIRRPRDPRASSFDKIYRVTSGTIALSSSAYPHCKLALISRRATVYGSVLSTPTGYYLLPDMEVANINHHYPVVRSTDNVQTRCLVVYRPFPRSAATRTPRISKDDSPHCDKCHSEFRVYVN